MNADLYDFDKTIYPTDSETVFWLYCLKKKPSLIRFLPVQIAAMLLFVMKVGDTDKHKSTLFSFLKAVDTERMVRAFWEDHTHKIFPYFIHRDKSVPVVVCSASPEFLVKPICEKLGVAHTIATRMNSKNGRIQGHNCKGAEKVRRLREHFDDLEFESVYTDSLKNDAPILALGKRRFHVVKGTVTDITDRTDSHADC